jgi:LysR family transcriptional regulator, glycine cleavage system transcriptional activator
MSIRLPSLNALKAFEAVARTGSVAAAAEELAVTPGAVSRQLRVLEEDLGLALVERAGRGLALTQAGARCYAGLAPAFAQIAATVRRLSEPGGRDSLVVAVEPVFAATWLVQRLDRLAAAVPDLDVTVDASAQRADPRRLSADVLIDYGRLGAVEGFSSEKLLDEEIFPVCSPARAASLGGPGDLARATLLHYDAAPRSWDWPDWATFLAAIGVAGVDARRGPRFVAGALVMEAAREGQGVALATTSIAHDDLKAGRLARPFAESLATDCGYYLLVPQARAGRADIRVFRTWLFDEIAACFGATAR